MTSRRDEFAGKVAIVTGAAGGIGSAVARRLSAAGATVLAVDLDGDRLDELARVEPGGGSITGHRADVADEDEVAGYVARALDLAGRIDLFFNNAGVPGRAQSFFEISMAEWRKVIDVNLTGVFLGLRTVLPHMVEQHGGRVVNTSSLAGLSGIAAHAAYVASKHGVVGLSRTAALEVAAHGVGVNAICPGPIATDLLFADAETNPHRAQRLAYVRDQVPLRRLGTTDDVAGLVTFLLSPRSHFITGAVLPIDGGLLAKA